MAKNNPHNLVQPCHVTKFSNICNIRHHIQRPYTLCFIKKNIPLAFLLYLSQMLFNNGENWNKYSSVK